MSEIKFEVKELGEVIAQREMSYVSEDGKKQRAFVRIGRPHQFGDETTWCCPYEISVGERSKVYGMFGVDGLQALDLTMKTLTVEIEYWEKSQKGVFFFLDEEDACIWP